jgi:hypothetical protein
LRDAALGVAAYRVVGKAQNYSARSGEVVLTLSIVNEGVAGAVKRVAIEFDRNAL